MGFFIKKRKLTLDMIPISEVSITLVLIKFSDIKQKPLSIWFVG